MKHPPTHFAGIDIGTSGTKVLLMDASGGIAAKTTVEYATASPHPMWSEQNPQDWWAAVCGGLREVIRIAGVGADRIGGVSFSGQMVGLVVLDGSGEPIRPCILWNDQRSAAVAERLTVQIGLETILRETSNPLFASFVAPKLVWMRENEPENHARIRHVLLPKDYIVYRLTGRLVTEVSDASGTCLFNVRTRRWSLPMMDAMELPAEWFPECLESADVAGTITERAADECGLRPGTPVIAGGGDQPVQALGSGIVRPGRCSVTVGTSGVVFSQGDRHLEHPEGLLHSFCHSVRGQWYLMGVMLSAGGSFQWMRETLRDVAHLDYDGLAAIAEKAPPGSEGLVFLPYLTGERCPHNDPHARGGWIGLTRRHTLAHLTRSVMEGITFGLKDSLVLMREMGLKTETVYLSGGAARSAFWHQMMADIFGLPVVTTNAVEGGAFGAAILAAVGAGQFNDVADAADALIRETGRAEPRRNTAYEETYQTFPRLYPALQPCFAAWTQTNTNP
jgi:xylulokinase